MFRGDDDGDDDGDHGRNREDRCLASENDY